MASPMFIKILDIIIHDIFQKTLLRAESYVRYITFYTPEETIEI